MKDKFKDTIIERKKESFATYIQEHPEYQYKELMDVVYEENKKGLFESKYVVKCNKCGSIQKHKKLIRVLVCPKGTSCHKTKVNNARNWETQTNNCMITIIGRKRSTFNNYIQDHPEYTHKELLDIVSEENEKGNLTSKYVVKCNKCGSIQKHNVLSRALTCPKESKCTKEKIKKIKLLKIEETHKRLRGTMLERKKESFASFILAYPEYAHKELIDIEHKIKPNGLRVLLYVVKCNKCGSIQKHGMLERALNCPRGSKCSEGKINNVYKGHSSLETKIHTYLDTLDISYKKNDRTILKGKELDIYIPSKNIAIEINGTYWHSEIFKDKKYHQEKTRMCREHNIQLIQLWEHDWKDTNRQCIIKSIINHKLGKTQNKQYARNLKVEILETKEVKDFFNENHLQGFRGGKFAIVLKDNKGEILQGIIIGHAFLSRGKYEYEIIRATTKKNVLVVGGISKLYKHFIKNYNPISIIYYVDLNYYLGTNLENLGFVKQKENLGYWNVTHTKGVYNILNRNPNKNKEQKELLKVWHSGSATYVYNTDK